LFIPRACRPVCRDHHPVRRANWEQASRPCRLAERAALRAERDRLLAEAAPWRERVAFFDERVYMCEVVEEDLAKLDATGQCPRYVGDAGRAVPVRPAAVAERLAHADLPRCDKFDEQGNLTATPNLLRRQSWEQ
jgi:hypothetical protein